MYGTRSIAPLVSCTTNEGAEAVGFGGESGNQRIVIDRRKGVENKGDSLHGAKPETVGGGRIRVTQNPEDAGQKHAAVRGMNGAQHAVARHVPGAPGLAGSEAQKLENSRDVDTDEHTGVSAGSAGRMKLAAQPQKNAAEMPPRGGQLGHPAGKTRALKIGVIDRGRLRHDLPGHGGEATQNPIRARTAGTTGMENTGHELGQVGRTGPARPRTRPAEHHGLRSGSGRRNRQATPTPQHQFRKSASREDAKNAREGRPARPGGRESRASAVWQDPQPWRR